MLLDNIYSTGVTHDDCHIFIVTNHWITANFLHVSNVLINEGLLGRVVRSLSMVSAIQFKWLPKAPRWKNARQNGTQNLTCK